MSSAEEIEKASEIVEHREMDEDDDIFDHMISDDPNSLWQTSGTKSLGNFLSFLETLFYHVCFVFV
jgi:hypothetical protein